MKKILVSFVILFFTACLAQDFPSVSAEDAYKMKVDGDSVLFVDVRTPAEFSGPLGHIDDAVLIPLQDLAADFHKLDPYKDKKLVVYCRSGNRSQDATRLLRAKGFDAVNMLGGIKAWNEIKSN